MPSEPEKASRTPSWATWAASFGLLFAACAGIGRGEVDSAAAAAGLPAAEPLPGTDGAPPPASGVDVLLTLGVTTLPGDAMAPPTNANGLLFDVADAAILSDPSEHLWWEVPASPAFACPAAPSQASPCEITIGPLDISHVVAAGRPVLLRTRPDSEDSPWATLMTALPTDGLGDGNGLVGIAYVIGGRALYDVNSGLFWMAGGAATTQGGVIGLFSDPNNQPVVGARFNLVDPSLVGQAPPDVIADGLRLPAWGTVDIYPMAPSAVFATTDQVLSVHPLPAAWMAVRYGEDTLVSNILPISLLPGNLVVLPLTLYPAL